VPFTADDVVYSLNKMVDPQRSAISAYFPAYDSSEKIDDDTVRVHLKYPSAGFLIALASGDAVIQPEHLAGTDSQSIDFMVGTGPFIAKDYIVRVHLKWERNPDYWKKDKNGNQLPYLSGLTFYQTGNVGSNELLISRQLDMKNPVTGAGTLETYDYIKNGAPDILWQPRYRPDGDVINLNLNHPPLNDIRVRRALAMLMNEEDIIVGSAGDVQFGITDVGILPPNYGLPKEEIRSLLGWDKTSDERVAEAQRLMAEAGYADGFKITMVSFGASGSSAGVNLVYADILRRHLNIDCEALALTSPEMAQRLKDDNYDLHTDIMYVGEDPVKLVNYFGTDGSGNHSHYSNPELDNKLAQLDRIIDPEERWEAIWDIERLLLTDLPALPTGTFIANIMPYYNWVKNIRWNNTSYSNVCRFEDIWIDQSIANQATLDETTPTPTPEATATPEPTATPTPTATPIPTEVTPTPTATSESYDRPDIPIIWESIDPPEAVAGAGTVVTFKFTVPAGSYVEIIYLLPQSGTESKTSSANGVAGADGKITLSFSIYPHVLSGEGTLKLTVTQTNGTKTTITRPYFNR
jgi:peptide/nickel transport system substrate-binding protein